MNKKVINEQMQIAYEALSEAKIANAEGQIEKTYRGQISSFGAAVTMGSLKPAIAFFSKDANSGQKEGSDVQRSKLMEAVLIVLKKDENIKAKEKSLFEYVKNHKNEDVAKENIINAAIALKLAMNLYVLV